MRNDARCNAFKLIFESLFHECDESLTMENLTPLKKEEDALFCENIVKSYTANKNALTELIESHLKNFEFDRLYKIDLAIIYLILTEVKYVGTPKAVAINEGLEIAKSFSTEKSHKFVNGIVSAILKDDDK